MAEQIVVSPGVFTQERDLSFLPQGIASIGAAFVGPTTKGPAFIPTSVQGLDAFTTTFGVPDGNSYLGYAVQNYLQEAGSATVVRVLGLGGYETNVVTLYASGSTGKKILAVLHPTVSGSTVGQGISSVTVAGTTASFSLLISTSNAAGPHISASGLSVTEGNISQFFGSNPQSAGSYPVYVYSEFANAVSQIGVSASLYASVTTHSLLTDYTNASTPWIKSQPIGGTTNELFKFHTLGDGVAANKDIKVSIVNIRPSTDPASDYGTFTLQVRELNNSDLNPSTLEQFDGLTLDPNSSNYIARVIGNSVPTRDAVTNEMFYEGVYPNRSKYVRVEMSTQSPPPTAVPYGFGPLTTVVSGSSSEFATGSYVTTRWWNGSSAGWANTGATTRTPYYGFNFTSTTSARNLTNLSYLAPTYGAITVGTEFNLSSSIATNDAEGSAVSLSNIDHVIYRQFSVPFQGGFDGLNPAREIALGENIRSGNTQGFDLTSALTSGSAAYKRGLDQLKNPDNIDLNLLVIPGVIYSKHSYIVNSAVNLCESRGDCFYILDLVGLTENVSTVTSKAAEIDSNYAAGYYPWVKIIDTNTNSYYFVPPSVVLPEVYQYNDNVGAEWFAPAGLNRGGIPGAVGTKYRLNQGQRDTLYVGKVNPIAQFPGQGICVWGQKTLQAKPSALDRVNVRRLLITVKKYIASAARYLVFEQNTDVTRNRFLSIVNPYLANIQQNSGLTSFRVVMDESNNTPDIIDRNILVGSIYLQPTRTAEFIKLDFNILPTGATFDNI